MIFLILCWAKLGLPNSSPRIEPSLVKWHTILAEVGSWFKRDQTSLDEKSSATPSVSFWFFGFWRKVGLTKASQQANGLFFFFLKKQANGLTLQKFYFFPPYLLASFWFVVTSTLNIVHPTSAWDKWQHVDRLIYILFHWAFPSLSKFFEGDHLINELLLAT